MADFVVSFAAGTGGTVTGTTPQTITEGGNCTAMTAVPNSNYTFVNWTGTNGFVTSTANPLTVTNVTAAHVITANFTQVVTLGSLTANATSAMVGADVKVTGTCTSYDSNAVVWYVTPAGSSTAHCYISDDYDETSGTVSFTVQPTGSGTVALDVTARHTSGNTTTSTVYFVAKFNNY